MRHWMQGIRRVEGWDTFRQPVVAELDGRTMTVATDGRMIVAVPGAVEGMEPATVQERENLAKVWATRPRTFPASYSLAQLRSFVGGAYLAPEEPCPECHNDGLVTCPDCRGVHGDYQLGCDRCDDDGEISCAKCSAEWGQPKTRVRIGRGLFDAVLVAAALRRFPGETVTWAQDEPDTVALVRGADGWLALIMPLRSDPEWWARYDRGESPTVPVYAEAVAGGGA